MPICLSQNRRFRGIYSKVNLVWDIIKKLEGAETEDDETFCQRFTITSPNGKIKFGENSFKTFDYYTLYHELKERERIALYDITGEYFLYAIWFVEMNEVYFTPSEIEEMNSPANDEPVQISPSEEPVEDSEPEIEEPLSNDGTEAVDNQGEKISQELQVLTGEVKLL